METACVYNMADANSRSENGENEQNGQNEAAAVAAGGGLMEFVLQEVQRQKSQMQVVDIEENDPQPQPPEVDQSRERNFFTSALSAINKMNAEVDKSKRKQEQLHQQFGAERYREWQAEHAAQVLTPQEASTVAAMNRII